MERSLLVGGRAAVPFFDLAPMHADLKPALLADLSALFERGEFTNGPEVAEFEGAFAEYCGTAYCVGVGSGLDGLRLALLAAGIASGDEVIVPAQTFAATFEAVEQAGGVPVVVDATEADYTIDIEAARAAITARTRFLLPVHLYGQMADMQAVSALAREHDLRVIEDACQAHGATRAGLRAGTAGDAGAFSFYPAKNLGAAGDAGAVVTGDERIAHMVRALREHGQTSKYHHERAGYTARLDTLQAIVLLHKLPQLDAWNTERRQVAGYYDRELAGVGDLGLPRTAAESEPAWHLYVVRTRNAAALADFLRQHGVETGRHYPEPPHLSPAYSRLGYRRGSFPVAEALAREALSLPLFPGISEEQLATVVASIRAFFGRG